MRAGGNSAIKQQTNSYKIAIPGGPMGIIFPRKDGAITVTDGAIAVTVQHGTVY